MHATLLQRASPLRVVTSTVYHKMRRLDNGYMS